MYDASGYTATTYDDAAARAQHEQRNAHAEYTGKVAGEIGLPNRKQTVAVSFVFVIL